MKRYTLYCTESQTHKALNLGAPICQHPFESSIIRANERMFSNLVCIDEKYFCIPTTEQMIGFILNSGRGYSIDLAELIKEYGYKQGCLIFIENSLK